MKKLFLTLTLITVVFVFVSFKVKKSETPPGTLQISTGFFVDKNEITVVDWREYMYWTKRVYGENSDEYKKIFPDTSVCTGAIPDNYFTDAKYLNYPIIGISYEQAVDYCKWRSDRVNEGYWIKETGKSYDFVINFDYNYDDLPKIYKYRLPTKAEWLEITKYKYVKQINTENNSIRPVSDVKNKGIYELGTNVSEMTSEKGVAMGGNWKSPNNYNEYKYDSPSEIIGFRCVCERKAEN